MQTTLESDQEGEEEESYKLAPTIAASTFEATEEDSEQLTLTPMATTRSSLEYSQFTASPQIANSTLIKQQTPIFRNLLVTVGDLQHDSLIDALLKPTFIQQLQQWKTSSVRIQHAAGRTKERKWLKQVAKTANPNIRFLFHQFKSKPLLVKDINWSDLIITTLLGYENLLEMKKIKPVLVVNTKEEGEEGQEEFDDEDNGNNGSNQRINVGQCITYILYDGPYAYLSHLDNLEDIAATIRRNYLVKLTEIAQKDLQLCFAAGLAYEQNDSNVEDVVKHLQGRMKQYYCQQASTSNELGEVEYIRSIRAMKIQDGNGNNSNGCKDMKKRLQGRKKKCCHQQAISNLLNRRLPYPSPSTSFASITAEFNWKTWILMFFVCCFLFGMLCGYVVKLY